MGNCTAYIYIEEGLIPNDDTQRGFLFGHGTTTRCDLLDRMFQVSSGGKRPLKDFHEEQNFGHQ